MDCNTIFPPQSSEKTEACLSDMILKQWTGFNKLSCIDGISDMMSITTRNNVDSSLSLWKQAIITNHALSGSRILVKNDKWHQFIYSLTPVFMPLPNLHNFLVNRVLTKQTICTNKSHCQWTRFIISESPPYQSLFQVYSYQPFHQICLSILSCYLNNFLGVILKIHIFGKSLEFTM